MSSTGFRYILWQRPDGGLEWPRPDIDGPALMPGEYAVMIFRSKDGENRYQPLKVPERMTISADQRDGYEIHVTIK
jgi:hypothetical protein